MKLAWHVPRATRTFLLQNVLACGITSAKVEILARYANFFQGLRASPSHEVSVLANIVGRDLRSTTGSNLKLLEDSTGLSPWNYSSTRIKEELVEKEKVEVPAQDKWRISYLSKLLEQKQIAHYMGDETVVSQVTTLIDSLCIN